MKRLTKTLGSALLIVGFSTTGMTMAAGMATLDEAKAMSEKAAEAVNSMGREKAFAAFSDENGGFQEKDLYVFCADKDGIILSHAKKPELVGQNLLKFNEYGDYLMRDMIAVSKKHGNGWVDYKWPYPTTEMVREKTSYIVTNKEDFFCGVGAYK